MWAWTSVSIPGKCKPQSPHHSFIHLPSACCLDSSFDLQLLQGTAKKTGKEDLEMDLGCIPEPLLSNNNAGARVYYILFKCQALCSALHGHHLVYPHNTVIS